MKQRTRTLVLLTAVTLTAGGLAASAAGGATGIPGPTGRYTACYDSGGSLKVFPDGTTTCPKGWAGPVYWNATGPAGAAGQPGPAGPPGPKGDPGSTSLAGLVGSTCAGTDFDLGTVTVAAGAGLTAQVSVQCAATGPVTGRVLAIGRATSTGEPAAMVGAGGTWSSPPLPSADLFGAVASDGSSFVWARGDLQRSGDGATWTQVLDSTDAVTVGFDGHSWLAAGDSGLWSSTDGTTWASHATPWDGTRAPSRVAGHDGTWVAVGSPRGLLASADGGLSWTVAVAPGDPLTQAVDVVWSGGRFVAVGSSVMTSVDGVTWSRTDAPRLAGVPEFLDALAGNGTSVVAASASGHLWTGPDVEHLSVVPDVLLPSGSWGTTSPSRAGRDVLWHDGAWYVATSAGILWNAGTGWHRTGTMFSGQLAAIG